MKKKYSILVVGIALAILAVGIWYVTLPEPHSIIGVYDKVGTDDFMEFKADGTTYSTRYGIGWDGIWTPINATAVHVNIIGGANNLIYIITDDGMMWRDTVYIKRHGD